jgi:transposase
MLTFAGKRIYLACGSTDGRKQINGLSVLVQASFNLDPFDAAIFVFCNRARDRLKILEYDSGGYWLYLKRLESGRFKWPDDQDGKTLILSDDELQHLLGGPGLEQKLRRKKINREIL